MLIDSHCHLNFPELLKDIDGVISRMHDHGVDHALCVCVELSDLPDILSLTGRFPELYASVGVHPDQKDCNEPSVDDLLKYTVHHKVVAIGETGLDYFRAEGDLHWQRERFRTHIRAAKACGKPLIIHTRSAAADTLAIMREEGADDAGGVMHCFTESIDIAQAAMALNFYISFSGIVTFKNAVELKEVARTIPLDRMLIETDAPYLAPVPFRGQTNEPAYVRYVAQEIAQLRKIDPEEINECTSLNFKRLFKIT